MKYNLAIIGAGPAGLIAAVRASQLGARVVLLEKNPKLGIKLLLTGGGRCNLTNNITQPRDFISQLSSQAKFLYSALHKFGVKETLEFFQDRGLKIKIENNNRVFPISNKSQDVLNVLVKELQKNKVEIKTLNQVKKIITKNNKIIKLILINGQEIVADKYILTTGGRSYPATGSSGDGYKWLEKMNHTIILPQPSLTPLIVEADFIKLLEGLSVPDAKLSLYQNNKKIISLSGDVIFTSNGLSGPASLDLSRYIDPAKIKELSVELDFLPQVEASALDKKLQQILTTSSRQIKNSLEGFVIPKFKPILFKLSQVDPDKKSNIISRQERLALVKLLKSFKLKLKALAGFDKAMITSGGVDLKEIDPQTMQSKKISNLFIAGELLDLDGPTGGYNLQICWSSGYLAGESAVCSESKSKE